MKKRPQIWLFIILVLTAAVAPHAAILCDFHFYRDIGPGEFQTEALTSVRLDKHVFAKSANGFADIRVFAGDQEVPYVLETPMKVETRPVQLVCPSDVITVRELSDNRIEIHARLRKRSKPATSLELVTGLRNFEKRVTVRGKKDRGEWQELARNVPVFDLSRFMKVAETRVALPANDCRTFRIQISNVTDTRQGMLSQLTRESQAGRPVKEITTVTRETRDFRIEEVIFRRTEQKTSKQTPRTETLALSEFKVRENKGEERTEILIQSRRVPLVGLTLETGSRNFSRTVILQRKVPRPGPSEWAEVARATLSRIEFRQFSRSKLAFRFSEVRENVLRLLILNGDSPPLDVTGLRAEATIRDVLFLAKPGTGYKLYYGGNVSAPKYDAATVLRQLRGKSDAKPIELPLGEFAENPGFRRLGTIGNLLNSKALLVLVMIVMVAILGWAVYVAVRKIDQIQPEDS